MEQQRAHDRDRTWAEWMRAANAGDEIAYRRLLEALAPLLRQVVRRGFTRSGFGNCDVEDVVQEVFLIAARRLDDLQDPPKIRGWLKTVTLRQAGRLLRWKRVRARFGFATVTESIEDLVASPGAGPEDRAALRELLFVLDRMSPDLRIAWSLRYLHDETIESVAELIGCSLATAKRRIAAAQKGIDRELSDE